MTRRKPHRVADDITAGMKAIEQMIAAESGDLRPAAGRLVGQPVRVTGTLRASGKTGQQTMQADKVELRSR